MAIALHAANQQRWSPSLIARSICYYKSASSFITRTEGAQRQLASRPVTLDVCKMMAECRPPSAWATGRHVFVYAFDQTYEWISMKKHGRRRVLERVDAHGMPIQITNEVRAHAHAYAYGHGCAWVMPTTTTTSHLCLYLQPPPTPHPCPHHHH